MDLSPLNASFSAPGIVASRAVDPDKAIRVPRFFSYPKQVLYLVASFIALVSLSHFISLAYRYAIRNRVYSSPRRPSPFRRFPIAVIDSLRAIAFRWTVPIGASYTLNLAEVGMTLGYTGVLLSWTFVNTTTTLGVKVEPHYYANRAATIAASQLPIMTALGMRNNIISWLTGISFDKLNYLHRLSARVICILVWIHAGGRITIGLLDDEAIVNRWVQCGVLAGTTLTLLCILTLRPVRERNYELFLIIHFIFVFMFLLAIYFHLTGRVLTYYGAWPSMIIWGLDRFLRLVNLTVFNFGYLNPWSKTSRDLDASVEVLSPRFLKVTVYRSKHFHWRPGQSAYLTFPSISTFPFQSHPFTISTIESDASVPHQKLTFFIRVRAGFTKTLMQTASSDSTYKVFINGPYSSPPLLMGFQSVILIAGGSGIAFTLPLLLDVLSRAKRNQHVCQKVTFIWAIRDTDQLKWIEEELLSSLEDLPESISISLQFFITSVLENPQQQSWQAESTSDVNDHHVVEVKTPSSSSSHSGSKILDLSCSKLEHGRPDLTTIIKDEIAIGTGPISINVCGTDTLSDTVRKAIRNPRPADILRGGPSVTLHVEAFGGSQ
ncbi:putative ferric reductase transmembrane component [Psilocybe cubensis]|uniref:FAD-binding FR-type domain-containing protein n=2 Tax=Psilocybe cubensis TaxID=181762 RepID=A0A8H8CIW6_PSICU|nr:putative ferric reductase transmembrane component [Psilocybe cubensis]KAH9475881.1 putative ferric reductase transmembrane component [Psilocybe cubensis]